MTTGCDFDIAIDARTVAAAFDSGEPGRVAPVGTRGCGFGDMPHMPIVLGGGVGVPAPMRCEVDRFTAPGGAGVDEPGMGPGFDSPGGISVAARGGGVGVGNIAIEGRPGGTSPAAPPENASSQITRARPDANGSSARPKSSMVAKRAFGSTFIARSTTSSISGGISGRISRGRFGVPPTIPWKTTNRFSPS